MMDVPEGFWPQADLAVTPSDITFEPAHPVPGQSVIVRVTVRNVGGRAVRQAHGFVVIAPCCDVPRQITHNFVGDVPLSGELTIERAVMLPEGKADIAVCVWAFPPPGGEGSGWRQRLTGESNGLDNCAVGAIGKPVMQKPPATRLPARRN